MGISCSGCCTCSSRPPANNHRDIAAMSIRQRREPGARALWNKGRLVGLGRRPRSSAMGHPHSPAAHAVHAGTRPPGAAVDDALEMTELTVACHLIGIEVRLAFPLPRERGFWLLNFSANQVLPRLVERGCAAGLCIGGICCVISVRMSPAVRRQYFWFYVYPQPQAEARARLT